MKLLLVAGARPNFMKVAPLLRACSKVPGMQAKLVHTGQHYDYEMSRTFFEDFGLPEPDHFLDVRSGTHAEQTARIMIAFEKVCLDEEPDWVVVVGDVNSTLACSVTAKKLRIRVAHVEAGLRSRDMGMPEEINRLVTDSISDLLFVTEKSGLSNLAAEGHPSDRVLFVGNVMIDTLFHMLARQVDVAAPAERYAVVTLHRPTNVDDPAKLRELLEVLSEIAAVLPVEFPMHPRTRKNVEEAGLDALLARPGMRVGPPLRYPEFLALWRHAALVLTDSGGIQEETTVLGIPCFTLRENTERPITVEEGTNILVGTSAEAVRSEFARFCAGHVKTGRVPELWDGHAAERIIARLADS
ncbi:MAG: UDP-N-acetylglucosamine 2-epimerase (non-hydrolyzing) [Deltaproteobacteria bacterium]|nr:UDP-N-acetylglucosamine 2-epimerase (non-hydrolyzing) [Deltaproteobacteria bacterium]